MAFVYFKVFNRDSNLGFQDFIIDKISGKKPNQKSVPNQAVQPGGVSVKKEEKPSVDVLANIATSNEATNTANVDRIESPMESGVVAPASPVGETTIPDWLKESTSLGSLTHTEDSASVSENV